MPKRVTWEKLRAEFPDVEFPEFLKITKEVNLAGLDEEGIEILRLILHEKNEKARLAKAEEEASIYGRLRELTEAMPHRELEIEFLQGEALEHAQAFLIYGLVMPHRTRTFAGGRSITVQVLQRFVTGKLGPLFNKESFDAAHRWLLRNGVIIEHRGGAISLETNFSRATAEGRKILSSLRKFVLAKSRA